MAEIAIEAKLSPEDGILEGASKLFAYLWDEAWQHGFGTASGDVESLHDMRVALRRLRTAMQNFEGPKTAPVLSNTLRNEIREQRTDLGKLGDRLGAVRDHDVLAGDVEDYARKKLKIELDESPGLATFVRYLQTERANYFGPMVKSLNKAQKDGNLREQFARWALGLPGASGAQISLETAAHLILPRRLEEVFAHTESLQPGGTDEEQHELRKSLRRVRYTLETLSVCFPKPVKPFVKTLVELQDLLGDMQDGAVLLEAANRAFGDSPPPDIEEFHAHNEHRRRYLLGRVRSKWEEHEKAGFWGELAAL